MSWLWLVSTAARLPLAATSLCTRHHTFRLHAGPAFRVAHRVLPGVGAGRHVHHVLGWRHVHDAPALACACWARVTCTRHASAPGSTETVSKNTHTKATVAGSSAGPAGRRRRRRRRRCRVVGLPGRQRRRLEFQRLGPPRRRLRFLDLASHLRAPPSDDGRQIWRRSPVPLVLCRAPCP